LKAKIPVCKAGGGFVHNKRVRFYLFSGTENGIYLRVESGEEIEDTAMREVEEKGSKSITGYKTTKTYHILSVTGSTSLKSPIGLKWSLVLRVCPRSVRRGALKSSLVETSRNSEALKNSYENIKLLFEEEKLLEEFFFIIHDRLDIANAPFHSRQSVCKPILIASGLLEKWGPLSFSLQCFFKFRVVF
jgi:hypothetical protein